MKVTKPMVATRRKLELLALDWHEFSSLVDIDTAEGLLRLQPPHLSFWSH